MEILLAGFIDNLSFDKVSHNDGNNNDFDITKIDVTGLHYTQAYSLPSEANPHLLVLATQLEVEDANSTLIVEFIDENGNVLARNVQPFPVESKKFGYRLVMGKFEVESEQNITTKITIPEYKKELKIPLIIKNKA